MWRELDRLLPKVSKPARYSGGELNSVVKPWDQIDIKVALAFPDVYEIGMSNLGLMILYDLLNREQDVLAERVYTPWVDMEAALRRAGLPLFSLESKRPLKDFDILGFSLAYELIYTNVLTMLSLAHIPLLAVQRTDAHPLIIGGGSGALNPEPMADFMDLMVMGEGEEVILELLGLYRTWKKAHPRLRQAPEPSQGCGAKEEFLRAAAQLPGVYVPQFYRVAYREDGPLAEIAPTIPEAPPLIQRRILERMPPMLTKPVVPYLEVVHDRAAIEIMRGCTRGCRFCQAGIIYRPMRYYTIQEILDGAEELMRNTGYEELSLLSLSSADYPGIDIVSRELARRYGEKGVSISLPSTRVDRFNVTLAEALQSPRKTSLTFAPEAGTQRLRRAINKGATEEDLFNTVEAVFSKGWQGLKLYFMVGLPTETLEDVAGIVELAQRARKIGRGYVGNRARISVGVSTFVAKPHTPFQWSRQNTVEELEPKHQLLRRALRGPGLHFSWNDPRESLLEGVLSRGDRRVGRAILRAWQLGCRFDAWSEQLRYDLWTQAFAETGVEPAFYNHRERPLDELLPWSHIASGVGNHYLKRDYKWSFLNKEAPDCMYHACYACGIERRLDLCDKAVEIRNPLLLQRIREG